jgi:hypothetical protein
LGEDFLAFIKHEKSLRPAVSKEGTYGPERGEILGIIIVSNGKEFSRIG